MSDKINFENEINNLKNSPIFNISLSSKELFHSNFIAWLIRNYPDKMWNIFSSYTKVNYSDYEIDVESIKREYKHIDLMFDVVKKGEIVNNDNKIKVIIENKVKSLPYIEQLEEYTKKYPDAEKILLSLSNAENIIKNGEGVVFVDEKKSAWKLFTYKQLANNLNDIKPKDTYESFMIKDYINLIKNLSSINDKARLIVENEKYNWYENTETSLHKIKLDSFVIKLKCENLALKIEESIKESIPNLNKANLKSNAGIVQGTNGEFRLYYKFNNRIEISIEVSKYFYRKMVHLSNTYKDAYNKKETSFKTQYDIQEVFNYFNEIKWFDFSQIKMQKYKPTKKFLKFGNTTRYLQRKISSEVSINDIINYFIRDLKHIIKYHKEIETKFK